MTLPVGPRAEALIIAEEVVSQSWYEKHAARPVWPGDRSGVTIGIGYDLGQQAVTTIMRDWSAYVPTADLTRLTSVAGLRGSQAQANLGAVQGVVISWDSAITVFRSSTLPRYADGTTGSLLHCDALHPDAFGVLVSISYNRGWGGWGMTDDRHTEMLAISRAMDAKTFDLIPDLIRDMSRLWPETSGVYKRRFREADLFDDTLGIETEVVG